MKIKKITLTNFRNYQKQTIELGSGINFIIGANGEGKTNFLEAIYFLALAKSYKVNDIDTLKYGEDFAKIQASIETNDRLVELTMIVSEMGKKALINQQEMKRLSEYIGKLNVVSFLPEDMNLVKGSPRERRYFIDLFLGQIDKNYLNNLTKYKYILRQRNELLKKIAEAEKKDEVLLDVLTEQLAESAYLIMERRVQFIQEINELAKKMYYKLSEKEELFEIQYQPSIQGEKINSFLKSKYKTDIYSKMTNFGPHRDDYDFSLGEYLAKNHASQGEQRMIVLALNMALGEMVFLLKKERPIFLLDDVFSELDAKRQNKLIDYLLQSNEQTIITTTSINEIKENILKQAKIFKVTQGYIKEERQNGK
ncbi:MAG: DNA replication/repair protein RecF [Firmicutes bacterium]|nr:DNA replication/repair protein RecF [Bacillota bacterium]